MISIVWLINTKVTDLKMTYVVNWHFRDAIINKHALRGKIDTMSRKVSNKYSQ